MEKTLNMQLPAINILSHMLDNGVWTGPYYSKTNNNWFMIIKEHLHRLNGFSKEHLLTIYENTRNDDASPIGYLFMTQTKNGLLKRWNWRVTNQNAIVQFCKEILPYITKAEVIEHLTNVITSINEYKIVVSKSKNHPKSGSHSPLANWRLQRGKTQEQIAKEISITAPYYAMLESGRRNITTKPIFDKLITLTGDKLIIEKMQVWREMGISKKLVANLCKGMLQIMHNLNLSYIEVRQILVDNQVALSSRIDDIAWGKVIPTDKELSELLDYMNPDEGEQLTVDQARKLFKTIKNQGA